MQVRIYHNEARGHFTADADEVSREGELHKVFEFELDDLDDPTDRHEINMTLAGIYHQLNFDTPSAQYGIDYRAARLRSLSIGDVVKLGDDVAFPFVVSVNGFEAIGNGALAFGIRRGTEVSA